MLEAYRKAAAERAALGIPALPLTAQQTADLVELLKNPPAGEGKFLVELLAHRVPPGVDDAAKVKASFLASVAEGSASSPLISPEYATERWVPCLAVTTFMHSSNSWIMTNLRLSLQMV